MLLCTVIARYQCFRKTCCLHLVLWRRYPQSLPLPLPLPLALLPQKTFDSKPVHVGFITVKVTVEQVSLVKLWFSTCSIITQSHVHSAITDVTKSSQLTVLLNNTNQPTNQLTTWSRVLPEKPTGPQLVKKFLAFYGTQKFITTFTTVHCLSLSSARSIQSMHPHPTSQWSILILSSHLRLSLQSD